MVQRVKRRYDADGRQAQSRTTRLRILDAARASFVERGYRATTVGEIARRADVHVDTLYALVGRKPQILRELVELAISGTDEALAPERRDYVQRMRAEPDPARKLRIYAGAIRAIQTRMAPLLLALRDAAATDPAAQQVWREIGERRAQNMRRLVVELGDDVLRPGMSVDDAADILWATAGSEMFVLLTFERGWPLERYERWLAEAWTTQLLRPPRRVR
ncbi:MAG: helix-turn-helix domain-containing protein [Ilumatobacteraceae bacterium]